MGYLGVKTDEVLETEMFSLLNQILKRSYNPADKAAKMKIDLMNTCTEYLMDFDHRPTHK